MTASVSISTSAASLRPRTSDRLPRTLLIGTAHSVTALCGTLSAAQVDIHGALLIHPLSKGASLPCPYRGGMDALPGQLAAARGDRVKAGSGVEQVLVSLPLAMTDTLDQLGAMLDRAKIAWRFMPTLEDQLAGRTTRRLLGHRPGASVVFPEASGELDFSSLINRTPQPLHERTIRRCVTGKTVLITGAGGSIGSELARVVGRFEPDRLLLVERSENALFQIDQEIGRLFPDMPRAAMLHDVTQRRRTRELMLEQKPQVIFHAAAHKHVPMMENHPAEAVENNFYGTRSIADAADAAGVERFVMISSDKAVNPSSVMGATKRLAELYIQHLNTHSKTTFAMVRFGNVLGSSCSVLPIWSQQLSRGGPLTVTHPEMTRYFMTIPEAAGLVIQAAALAEGGEVFLLDMGKPVRIVDLAHRFARQQGFEPGVDVEIQFTGPRPGEKLFELLAYDSEDMLATRHASIHRWAAAPPRAERVERMISTFDRLRDGERPKRQGGPEANAGHPWQHACSQAIVTALRAELPEMTLAAAA